MHAVFPSVYIIDSQRFSNSLVIATNTRTHRSNFLVNTAKLTNPTLQSVAQASIVFGHLREEQKTNVYFTDDKAPVEQLIDQMILDAVRNGK